MSLMEALSSITNDNNSYKFKKMIEIIKATGKLRYDEIGEMEVFY